MRAAIAQPRSAVAMSCSRFCVSQVKPSPVTCHSTPGCLPRKASSPVSVRLLMNCTTPTFMPWPSARATMPNAEVLLPLPLPVMTSSSPRSSVAAAIAASTTAFLRAMRAAWRAFFDCPWLASLPAVRCESAMLFPFQSGFTPTGNTRDQRKS